MGYKMGYKMGYYFLTHTHLIYKYQLLNRLAFLD